MFNKNMINTVQRGYLKEIILDNDITLIESLKNYENNGNLMCLYNSILKLISKN